MARIYNNRRQCPVQLEVVFFSIPPIPLGQTVLPTAIPLKAPLKHYLWFYDMHTVILLQSQRVSSSTQMGGVTVGYKTLILSTQVKPGKMQGKVHRSDSPHCNPTQSSSETLPVFSLQCFHQNGWTPSGVRNFNPFLSVLLPTGMGGKLKTPSCCNVYDNYDNERVSCEISTWIAPPILDAEYWREF